MRTLVKVWNCIRKHKYMATTIIFVIIILFLDENNWMRRAKNKYEIHVLQNEIEYYRNIYERDTERLEELQASPYGIEKVARERYLMKTPDEDIYIFETNDN